MKWDESGRNPPVLKQNEYTVYAGAVFVDSRKAPDTKVKDTAFKI